MTQQVRIFRKFLKVIGNCYLNHRLLLVVSDITATFNRYRLDSLVKLISVVPMQLALQLDEKILSKPPPFCSHFEFEFYENEDKQEFVQIFFNGEAITIRGAKSTIISKEEFLMLTKWVRRSQIQLEAEINEFSDPEIYLSSATEK